MASLYSSMCFNLGISYCEEQAPLKFAENEFTIPEFGSSEDEHALPSFFQKALSQIETMVSLDYITISQGDFSFTSAGENYMARHHSELLANLDKGVNYGRYQGLVNQLFDRGLVAQFQKGNNPLISEPEKTGPQCIKLNSRMDPTPKPLFSNYDEESESDNAGPENDPTPQG